jgi:hypothetical protein
MDAALLDTCVLLKSYLCDTLLSIAEEGRTPDFLCTLMVT